MELTLALEAEGLSDEQIDRLARSLSRDLRNELPVQEVFMCEQGDLVKGTRGDPITLGTIVLSLVGSGGVAVALINILKVFAGRDRRLKIKIKTKEGAEIQIDAENLSASALDSATQGVDKLLKGEKT
jgi:hypothetical protein